MKIYEKIFARLEELHMSQIELSRQTGIATSTISDWGKKHINPQADKLVAICKALDMSLVDLLCDEEEKQNDILTAEYMPDDDLLIETIRNSSEKFKRRIVSYIERQILFTRFIESHSASDKMRTVSIIHDAEGNKIVLINDIIFKGKRSVEWVDVEKYLRKYVGEFYQIADTKDIIYIGTDLPDEYTGSNYTKHIKGTVAKAKANAAQAIPEMIEIAISKEYEENKKNKHSRHAKNGWYRYDTTFALPVYQENGNLDRYNVFSARLLIRHASSGKMYLYDVIEIKKETSKSCQA
ncbi:MAG: helix-turn-helix domain-containing protein [Lachnospira sp.]